MSEINPGDKPKKKRIRRSKNFINAEIMKAVSAVIGEQGFAHLGINSVAIEAKVEKPFIYRNFGTFDKVLEQYILKNDYFMKVIVEKAMDGKVNEEGKISDVQAFYTDLLTELYKTVDESRDFKNLVLWEIYEDSSFIRKIANRRENEVKNDIAVFENHFKGSDVDIDAITALLMSGIYYTTLHKDISTFCGVDFKTKEGKKRMKASLELISKLIFEHAKK